MHFFKPALNTFQWKEKFSLAINRKIASSSYSAATKYISHKNKSSNKYETQNTKHTSQMVTCVNDIFVCLLPCANLIQPDSTGLFY